MNDPEQAQPVLPRLLYLGSLAVEATSAGQMQLFRLLQSYPKDRLRIIEADCPVSLEARRIPGGLYTKLDPAFRRGWFFARHRMPRLFWWALKLHAAWQARRAARLIAPFKPEAVLTIHDGFGWFTAEKLAQALDVPLHIILHDDWNRTLSMAAPVRRKFDSHFQRTYRSAASRLCISPFMEEAYSKRFGAQGTVLYPMRNPESQSRESPAKPADAATATTGLTVAYAGNIFHSGYWDALRDLATALRSVDGRLIVFGPSEADAMNNDLTASNVSVRGFVRDVELLQILRAEALVLFVPMTFDEEVKLNMQISFPSKLAEYSALALPLLISGPEYCSAVRWARLYPGSAEVVTTRGAAGFLPALRRLSDSQGRETLGLRASELGHDLFSYESVSAVFEEAIRAAALAARVHTQPEFSARTTL